MKKEELLKLISITKKMKLLYVEDDKDIAIGTQALLSTFFNDIIYAQDGQEGLEKFNESHIDLIITDINMPNLNGLEMLKEIKKLHPNIPSIITTAHSESEYYQCALELNVKGYLIKPLVLASIIEKLTKVIEEKNISDKVENKYNRLSVSNKLLLDIGYQISNEKDHNKLMETILIGAKKLSNADGGTLYLFDEANKTLEFQIAINSSLNIHFGGTRETVQWEPLQLYNEDKSINKENVSVVCATTEKLVNIHDVYHSKSFNFAGVKKFDSQNKYKTTSMLVIPMLNRDSELVGVIQLINKLDDDNEAISFNSDDESLIYSMASQATMMLENNKLVKDLEILLYSIIKSIGFALNEKSNYTAKHIDNVASISEILAKAINEDKTIYSDVQFNKNELEEIKLSAWLHDIGKIATPEHIINKSTKLETICDRIELIEVRLEILKKDIEISYLKNKISVEEKISKINTIEQDLKFLYVINNGEVFMDSELEQILDRINSYDSVIINNLEQKIITKDEFYNLSAKKGTLSSSDREVINNHVVVTYNMLKAVPFPKKFKNVPKIAGSHHKTVSGGGYAAEELMNLEMTVADKILVIADIFEALSSSDRPYKDPNTLNEIANIFKIMVQHKELDRDMVKLFFDKKLYENYAKENLKETQIDEVTVDFGDI